MDNFHSRYGTWALIAGSAEGIGAGFANVLASRGLNLMLADNNEKGLDQLISGLEKKYRIRTQKIILDLGEKDAWKICSDALRKEECRLLVYNTAFSIVKRFPELTHEELDRFEDINNRTLIHLVHEFTRILQGKKATGGIILMSSLAGLVGPRFVAPYAGTKGFVNLLGEALHQELKKDGIDVTVCCAGTTSTPTFRQSEPDLSGMKPAVMQSSEVAEYAVKNLGRKAVCIPGMKNRVQYFFLTRLLPRKLSARIVSYAIGKIYPDV